MLHTASDGNHNRNIILSTISMLHPLGCLLYRAFALTGASKADGGAEARFRNVNTSLAKAGKI